jgi:hypothetical protein
MDLVAVGILMMIFVGGKGRLNVHNLQMRRPLPAGDSTKLLTVNCDNRRPFFAGNKANFMTGKSTTMYAYDTITAAVNGLKQRGYSMDFNLAENCIVCHDGRFNAEEFEITEVYRFEGESDPADEAAVYAIESIGGQKGVLVTGYGPISEDMSSEMARKLHVHRN